ncbi:MAG: aspartyl/asparaginyl beta-hydroxylase domain-containing protein [Acidiferrobacterales bacterium]|nr:aspartyl/asparaginyl beta-hydroxylase domain-containing protein [Acidiferrobacterales bacterium]
MAAKSSIDTLFSVAQRAHQEGRLDEALAGYDQVLAHAPAHVGALYHKGLLAFQGNQLAESTALLREACAVMPDDAELNMRAEINMLLGHLLLLSGQAEEALNPLERASAALPLSFEPYLKSGLAQLSLGRRDAAQECFQRALMVNPGLRFFAHADESLPAAFREEVRVALEVLEEREWTIATDALNAAASVYSSADLARVERGFRIECGREARVFTYPLRQPLRLYLPDLPAIPWFEREQFDWVPRVEEQLPAVRAELETLIREEAQFIPYISEGGGVDPHGTDYARLEGSMEWNAFHLTRCGQWLEDRCHRCPQTTEIMRAVPAARMRGLAPEILFSRLQGGGHIVPHFGRTNVRLTVHMGIVVPDNCAIRVANEIRGWQEGRIMLFDDSFEHEAWNRSERDRSVLIFEVWHPGLEPAEIIAIEHFFDAREAWLDLCKPAELAALEREQSRPDP